MNRATLKTVWLIALTAGFVGSEVHRALTHTAQAAVGSAADGCSGKDCAVASLACSGPVYGSDISAYGAFISYAGRGEAALTLQDNSYIFLSKKRAVLGSPSHFITSNGDNLVLDASTIGGGIILSAPNISVPTNDARIDLYGSYPGSSSGFRGIRNSNNGSPVAIDDAQGLIIWPGTLKTCAGQTAAYGDDTKAPEGTIMTDSAAGISTGHRTRLCLCTSDGGGTPAYKWQNIVSGTLGTTTTCAD